MPQVIEDGLVLYLLDVAEQDGRHYAIQKAQSMQKMLAEIIAHSVTGDPKELLEKYQRQLEITLSVL